MTLSVKWACRFELFFFKQKTAYEMRISDWSSDVCSSDLVAAGTGHTRRGFLGARHDRPVIGEVATGTPVEFARLRIGNAGLGGADLRLHGNGGRLAALARGAAQDLEAEHAGENGADRKSTRLNSSH